LALAAGAFALPAAASTDLANVLGVPAASAALLTLPTG
jgi:hypothetical protein